MNLKPISGMLRYAGYNEIAVNDMLMGIEEYTGNEEIQHVSISEGAYAISRKMRNIERIYTAGILRDWQDQVVEEIMLPNLTRLLG